MQKAKFIVILVFIFFSKFTISQSSSIKGIVVDPQKAPLEFVSVALLNPKDSTLVNYTITDSKGAFQITETSRDSILLQLSSLGFTPYYKTIVYQNELVDLKTIILEEELNTLDEIMISAVIPIQIKKDTVAFNANSFKVNYDDNIEELLKKLPGIEIDSEGNVVAQGNEVTKIFVDGKEFFGGDPSIVLKNLSADAISKIEVIDKKSDEAELTGVSDGNKEVVINFTLKKTKTQQGFGKASVGIGLESKYFTNLNYNKFSSKTQLSVIGKFNNINITGSNIQSFLKNADGIADDSDDDNNGTPKSLSGFLTTGVTGFNIGHEFKKKESFNLDYFYNHSNNNGLSNSSRITFANANNFSNKSENVFDNSSNDHNLNFNYKNKSHKMHSLIVRGGLTFDKRTADLVRDSDFLNNSGDLTTTNNFDLKNNNKRASGKLNINYYQRFLKARRSFGSNFNALSINTTRNNDQNTYITRNIGKTNESQRYLLTLRDESSNTTLTNFNFNFTEPLWKNHYFKVITSARIKNQKDNANQSKTTTISETEEAESLAFQFQNKEYNYLTKFAHSYNTEIFNISTGIQIQDLNRAFGETGLNPITKNQFYVNPSLNITYTPKKGTKHKFAYNRLITSPSSNQITTVVNDLNPYSIRKGNPDLKTQKIDNISLSNTIHDFKSALSFHSKIQFRYSKDAIISTVIIDEDYIKIRSYENRGNRKELNTSISFSKKINSLGLRYSLKNKNSYKTSNAVVNLENNDVSSQDYLFGFTLENYNKNIFDIKIGATYDINTTTFSIKNDLNRKFTKQRYFLMLDYDISKKISFNTQFDYIVFKDNKFSDNQELPIWNAAISYAFSNNKNNIMKLVFIDILDKNEDISRRSTLNYFEETVTESLGRYIVLSYTYRLHNGKKKNKKA
jgi:hypothetical protein